MNEQPFSPKEFMRARRPEKFSDSVTEVEPQLDRSALEYHLDTLTNRSQEIEFQRFAHALAEQEICPNLLPQTGPTGGGDSKVDSETYPVADSLALAWYTGIGREAASERWAFAFSSKKKWRDKLQSDIANIAATGRGYAKAFFVTNQFVPDKSRGVVEDALRKKHHFDVRVLDRTWILDKVFGHRHHDLAIRELNITVPTIAQKRTGPADTHRLQEMEKLEQQIDAAVREGRYLPELVNDCINAAVLSRELERPRVETDGRFDRAARIAEKVGNAYQEFECAYQRAWTALWWHEDYPQLASLYAEVEKRAIGSRNSFDLQRLANLWQLLHTAVKRGKLSAEEADIQPRTERLVDELERLSKDVSRPSTALQAETSALEVKLSLAGAAGDPVDPILRSLRDVVSRSEGLVGYPLEPLVKIVTEFGEFLGSNPAYGELFETIVRVASSRQQELAAARLLFARGQERLIAGYPGEAVRVLGRSLRGLHKHESRYDSIRALYMCGCAYERLGLLWAARGTLLAAASLATDELWRYGDVTQSQWACYMQLKWIELQLGRIPQALCWHECERVVSRVLEDRGGPRKGAAEQEPGFDCGLAALLLRTDFWELKTITSLPDVLGALQLPLASGALLYALGHVEELRAGHADDAAQDLHEIFLRYRDLPGWEDLAKKPSFCESRKTTLESDLLGCHLTLEAETGGACLRTAESVLAALESVLATTGIEGMVAREPVMAGEVLAANFQSTPVEFELKDSGGRPHLTVRCAGLDPLGVAPDAQVQIKKALLDLVVAVIARVLVIPDPRRTFEELFGGELAWERALDFTGSYVRLGNILGKEPKDRISDWIEPGSREYPLNRLNAWDHGDPPTETTPRPDAGYRGWSESAHDSGRELPDPDAIKHRDIQTVSVIREPLWNRAEWWGTGFLTTPDGRHPPALGLVFRDAEAGKEIFEHWRRELGTTDKDERLRIAIVRGISAADPYSYRILVGPDPEVTELLNSRRYLVLINRIHTMHPDSSLNLDRFLENYERSGHYYVMPATSQSPTTTPEFFWHRSLAKRELHLRPAWEIGRNDAPAIHEDDSPVIPSGKANPPIAGLLQWLREQRT
jgi:tetratricopeptide (TPR) repeat protein